MPRSPFALCGRRWPSEARSDEGCRAAKDVNKPAPVCLPKPPISALLRFSSRPFLHALSSSSIIPVSRSHGNTDHDGGLVGRDRCLRRWVDVTRAQREAAAVLLNRKAALEKRAGGRGMSPCQSLIIERHGLAPASQVL